MTDPPPAELLARLRPIPTYRDHPATTPSDLAGVHPDGTPATVTIVGSAETVLLLFLSAACLGCRDLWQGQDELAGLLPEDLRVVVVTPGPEHEDPAGIAGLAQPGLEVVMSDQAQADYRVAGPPFLALVDGRSVRTEGVAWGVAETARAVLSALGQ